MSHQVREASTEAERELIYALRYRVLRQPWQQPYETSFDSLEASAVNAYVASPEDGCLACGRLQENENKTGQIRYMAVQEQQRGKGLGAAILAYLERRAVEKGLNRVQLQARENAVSFYRAQGYTVTEKSFLLWGKIQHWLMEKELGSR